MNAACCICGDLFSASDDIYVAPCGHAFHHACLLQWIERSKSCPQCRKRTDADSLVRVFFNFPAGDGGALDAVALQARLDSVEFDRAAQDRTLRAAEERNEELRRTVDKLKSDVESLRKKVDSKSAAVEMMKARVEYAKADAEEAGRLRAENGRLTAELDTLRSLQNVVEGTAAEVEAAMRNSPDPRKLATFIVVLKKSVLRSESKKKCAQEELRSLRSEFNAVNSQRNELAAKYKSSETTAVYFENKYNEIKKRLAEYEVDDSAIANCEISTTIETGEPEIASAVKLKRTPSKLEDRMKTYKMSRLSDDVGDASRPPKKSIDKSEISAASSPYLCLKRNAGVPADGLPHFPSKSNDKTGYYIFKNKKLSDSLNDAGGSNFFKSTMKKQEQMETVYDGFGGHAKPSNFPSISPKKFTKKNLMNFKKKL